MTLVVVTNTSFLTLLNQIFSAQPYWKLEEKLQMSEISFFRVGVEIMGQKETQKITLIEKQKL